MSARVKNFVKVSLYTVGYYHAYRTLRTPPEARLVVLMYHDILDDARAEDPTELDDESPTSEEFAAHLREIKRHYPVLPLDQAVERLRRGTLEGNTISLTFDDGYASVHSLAFPLLSRLRLPATVFLLTDWIEGRTHYWWPRVRSIVQRSDFAGVTRQRVEEAIGSACHTLGAGPPGVETRRMLTRTIEREFRDLPDEERDRRLASLERLLFPTASGAPAPPPALTWEQVREMSSHGIDFEPHTCSHINIRSVSRERIQREIEVSRRAVEERTGRRPMGFAYPYGKDLAAYTPLEELLRERGFAYAITAAGRINSRDTNPYLLRRECLPNSTSPPLLHRSLILAFTRASE